MKVLGIHGTMCMFERYTRCACDENITLNSRREYTEESIVNVLPNETGN